MNYVKLFEELKSKGWNVYKIHNKTGITYDALRKLKTGVVTDPRVSTHNKLVNLLKKDVKNG
jgi:DNA-binding Xre family transcriptional regulator